MFAFSSRSTASPPSSAGVGMRACVRAFFLVCACVRACVRFCVCVRAHVCAGARVCGRPGGRAFGRACVRAGD